ncbi:MAG: elongator complex protein 3 [bacterium]|jgi:histone acetyltransferase (RNA polymerase elongator complex component)
MKVLPLYLPHLGCRHLCVYCNQPLTVGHAEDQPGWNRRLEEAFSTSSRQEWELAFYGGTFSALSQGEMEQCFAQIALYQKDPRVTGIRISTRPDAVESNTLKYLWQRGVRTIELGVESLDDRVLQKSGRGHTSETAIQACHRVKEFGFRTGIHLMCGLPRQNTDSWRETVDTAVTLPIDMVRIAPTLVLKGTALEQLYRRGTFQPITLEEAIQQCMYGYRKFYAQGIAIVRVGLSLSDDSGSGEDKIIAGPWHPALRHEVEARLVREKVLTVLSDRTESEIRVHPRDISIVLGEKKCNPAFWSEKLGSSLTIRQEPIVERHHFMLDHQECYCYFK